MRLDYSRGPGAGRCPAEQAFRDAIGAKVARDLFAASPPPTARLVVRLGRRGAGYEGTAELRDAAGAVTWSKVFPPLPHPPAATCASLIPALAFGVSIEVDPVDFPSMAPPTPPVVELPIVTAPADKPMVPAHVEASPRPFHIGVSPWLDFATAPRLAFGLSTNLGFRVAWFSLDLEGRWDPPAASTVSGAEVRTSRLVGALVPCGHVRDIAGCLLAEVDSLWATVTGSRINGGTQSESYKMVDERAHIYGTVGGRLSLEVEIAPRLALRPALDLVVPMRRPSLHIAGVSRWEGSDVSGRVGLGLLASF